MGAWGYEDHENDTFLDYIEDDKTPANLIAKLKPRITGDFIVAILNCLPATERSRVPKQFLVRAKDYLESELVDGDPSWSDKQKRKEALERQLDLVNTLI